MIADFVAAATSLWQYWNNPFLLRSFRSDWRGKSWITSFGAQFAGLVVLVLFLSALPLAFGPVGLAAHWGGSWGGFAIVFLCLLHFFMVLRGAGAGRRRELLTDEARRGTLESLLVTPMSRADIILKSTVYAFLQAGALALVALPVYLICAATGDVSLATIFSLYVVFLLLAFRPAIRLRHSVLAHTRYQQAAFLLALATLIVGWLVVAKGGDWWEALHSGGILFTWVYEMAAWLGAPIPWFGLRVPPIVVVVLLHPLHLTCGILMASAELEAEGRAYLEALAKVRFWYRLLLGLAILGFLWTPVLVEGDLAGYLGLSGGPAGAFAFVVSAIVAVVAGSETLETARTRLDLCAGLGCRLRFGRSAWAHIMGGVFQALSAVFVIPVVHLLGCVAGLAHPYPPGSSVLFQGLIAAAATICFCYAAGLLLWLLLARRRWLYSASFLAVVGVLVFLPWLGLSMVGGQGGSLIAALSPVSAFAAVTGEGSGWFAGAAVALPSWLGCVGIVLLLAALLLSADAYLLGRRLRTHRRATSAVIAGAADKTRREERPGLVERLVARMDNPIATEAARLAARTGGSLVAPVLMAVAICMALAMALSTPFPLGAAPVFAVPKTALSAWASAPGWGNMVGWRIFAFVGTAGGLLAGLSLALTCGSSFVDERRRKVFGFVLLAPLTDREIVDGRIAALGAPVAAALALCAPFMLAGAAVALSVTAALNMIAMLAWAVLLTACAGYAGLSGALTLRVTDGGGIGRAVVYCGLLEGARWIVCLIARAASHSLSEAWWPVASGLATLLAIGIAVLGLMMARYMAYSAVRNLRATDPFAH